MTLVFIFGMLAVLVISFFAVCGCMVIVGIVATIHRFVYLPLMRMRQPWLHVGDGPAASQPVGPGLADVVRYRLVLETIAAKRARLVVCRRELARYAGDDEFCYREMLLMRECSDLVCDLWFLSADRRAFEDDSQFMRMASSPAQRLEA